MAVALGRPTSANPLPEVVEIMYRFLAALDLPFVLSAALFEPRTG